MPELLDEIRSLATALAATEDDDVRDSAAILCRQARHRRLAILGLLTVDAMVHDGPDIDDSNDPRLIAVHEWFHDGLTALLRWARATGRVL
jgi:hypothetical protein